MADPKDRKYVVITGDIIKSREINTADLLENIPGYLSQINTKYNPLSHFRIAAGDEIQGLVKPSSAPFRLLLDTSGMFYPMKVKFGIGYGSISTDIKENVGQMRGEAFESARNALNSLRSNRVLFKIEGEHPAIDSMNTILMLFCSIVSSWNELVYRRYQLYSQSGSVHKVAEAENVSAEAINKHLNVHSVREIISAVKFLDRLIAAKYQPSGVDI